MFSDFSSSNLARLHQQRIGFRSFLDGSGLDAARAISNPLLRD